MNTFILSCIVYLFYIILRSRQTLHMLQQNKYNAHKTYIKWLIRNPKKGFKNPSIIFIILIFFIFYKNIRVLMIVFNLIYLFLIINILSTKSQTKLPLKYTSRVKRLIFTNIIIHIIPIVF